MRNPIKTSSWHKTSLLIAAMLCASAPAAAQENDASADKEAAAATRGELEVALTALTDPVARRVVVRNEQNQYDVWLISKLDFEKVSEVFRQAISAKRTLSGGLRIERWTWIDADRSYVLDVVGGVKPYRVRLTRHLAGAMLELEGAGAARDAPRWAPPYRPRPILLPHGQNR